MKCVGRRSETGVEPGAPAAQRDGCRDSSDAGEPAVLTTMSAAMHRYVEVVKQYPGPEQVDMRVEIEVPGSWFGAGPMGALTDAERREKYTAQAVEYAEVREFPGACRGWGAPRCRVPTLRQCSAERGVSA